MTSFLEFLGGYDFINEKYPIRNRAELPHLRSFLNKELSEMFDNFVCNNRKINIEFLTKTNLKLKDFALN